MVKVATIIDESELGTLLKCKATKPLINDDDVYLSKQKRRQKETQTTVRIIKRRRG